MIKNVTQYDLLISCPGDIKEEIGIINECVAQFNEEFTNTLGITIRTRQWEKSSYAQSGGKPQQLLNEQFVYDCDAAVALLWTRFGTPTDLYGSGTEEEIEVMLDKGKQVFMYFSEKEVHPSDIDSEQYKKVKEFKEKYRNKGIYFDYSSGEEFRRLFYAHLTRYFLTKEKITEIQNERCPFLRIVGIDYKQQIQEKAPILDFSFSHAKTVEQFKREIKELYRDISLIQVTHPVSSDFGLNMRRPIVVEENVQNHITEIAEAFDIVLPEDFFALGSLSEDLFAGSLIVGSSANIYGTSEEKKKYHEIIELYEKIVDLLDWAPIERAFSDKKCLMLALQNYGTAVDEDIEISLRVPRSCYEDLGEFSLLKGKEIFYLLNDCNMSKLFSICSAVSYANYSESIISNDKHRSSLDSPYAARPEDNDYDDLYDKLQDIFCYSVYDEGENVTFKLKMDCIKHNTTIAFPIPIFVKDNPEKISYKITSKYSPEIITGKIETIN